MNVLGAKGVCTSEVKGACNMKVRLFCAGGMSTSLLVRKIEQAAKDEGVGIDIIAHGVSSIEREIDPSVDVVLIGPQIGYQKNQVKKVCDQYGIPMDVIPMTDYGMVNGKGVWELTKRLAARS